MEGIRLQKVLSENGVASRRKAEEYIIAGRVTVNGRKAELGQRVDPRKDIIAIDGQRMAVERRSHKTYLMLYKPRGYVTTMKDEMDRRCVASLLEGAPAGVYPVGRLDKNSEGLLLCTNDGDFANLIMHPRNHISKTYRVTVRGVAEEKQLIAMSSGVMIDSGRTSPAQIRVLTETPERTVLEMVIHEGKNRQIRKMCEAVGLVVVRLKRTSVGPLRLGMLKPGSYRELTPAELTAIRNAVKPSGKPGAV